MYPSRRNTLTLSGRRRRRKGLEPLSTLSDLRSNQLVAMERSKQPGFYQCWGYCVENRNNQCSIIIIIIIPPPQNAGCSPPRLQPEWLESHLGNEACFSLFPMTCRVRSSALLRHTFFFFLLNNMEGKIQDFPVLHPVHYFKKKNNNTNARSRYSLLKIQHLGCLHEHANSSLNPP